MPGIKKYWESAWGDRYDTKTIMKKPITVKTGSLIEVGLQRHSLDKEVSGEEGREGEQ